MHSQSLFLSIPYVHTHTHTNTHTSYYPLVPAFYREDGSSSKKADRDGEKSQPPFAESTEVNLDLIHGLDYQNAMLPVRPDLLLLPSDLKPFAKVGMCMCAHIYIHMC